MKCDSCQEKATVFYTQVTDGKLRKFSLCESCADAKGITSPDGLLMPEELFSEPSPGPAGIDLLAGLGSQKCETCGFTLEDFRKVGRLGCAKCYDAFRSEIALRLSAMHKGTSHTGYLPEGLQIRQEIEAKLSELSEKLDAAVLEERYEDAARLRDQIEELKAKGKGSVVS